MFTQDFHADFDAILNATSPFALARWGDGELALMDGVAHKSADQWQTRGPSWLREDLYHSLRHIQDGYCVGIPPACCIGGGQRLRPAVKVPRDQQTMSTIFLHGNLSRIGELVERFAGALIVGSWFGDESFRVPPDGVTVQWDLDGLVERLRKIDRPILLAAGPCANLIVWKYWRDQPTEDRQTIIDVGSALDVHFGRKTRHYHDTMHKHMCKWISDGKVSRPHPTKKIALATARHDAHPMVKPVAAPAPSPRLVIDQGASVSIGKVKGSADVLPISSRTTANHLRRRR